MLIRQRLIPCIISLMLIFITTASFGQISPNPTSDGQSINDFSKMLKQVMPAVVNITVLGELPHTPRSTMDDEKQQTPRQDKFRSVGSGVIVNAEKGYIVTNAHVISNAKLITISTSDGRQLKAKEIGVDKLSDIAVLQVRSKHLTAIPFANSEKVKVGEFVAAIGNPFGLHQTVTSGMVSALHRSGIPGLTASGGYENYIQTDAPINPGNSGGALINTKGQLIGINTAIVSPISVFSPIAGNVGIGFAIPSNMVKHVMHELIVHGKVKRGLLGVTVQDLTPALADAFGISGVKGALVTDVKSNTPAAKAGIKSQDVIEKLNGQIISNAAQLQNLVGMLNIGQLARLTVRRGHETLHLHAKIADPKTFKESETDINPLLDGVRLGDFDELVPGFGYTQGVEVLAVDETSEAWMDGVRPGDVILAMNHHTVSKTSDLLAVANRTPQGKSLLIKVARLGGVIYLVLN